jgi:hypothetical protein
VLLETVALCAYQGAKAPEAGHVSEGGHLRGDQPKRPVASGSNSGHSDRDDQPVAQGSGSSVCQRAVGKHPLPDYGSVGSVNRPVRTRTPGGVGLLLPTS